TRGGFPTAFVEIAWAQWLGVGTDRRIRENSDAVVLVTGSLARDVGETWSRTLAEVLETSPERMAARLTAPDGDEGSQSSRLQRALVESFQCPETLRDHGDNNDLTMMRLLRHTRLLYFDY